MEYFSKRVMLDAKFIFSRNKQIVFRNHLRALFPNDQFLEWILAELNTLHHKADHKITHNLSLLMFTALVWRVMNYAEFHYNF